LLAALAFGCSSKPGASVGAINNDPGAGGWLSPAGSNEAGRAASAATGSAGQPSAAGATGAADGGRSSGTAGVSAAGTSAADGDDAGTEPAGDAGTKSDAGPARTMQPIEPPVADDCIKDVSAGDHTFSCDGLTFLVLVDEMCTKLACGLIFDIHGATMSGAQMRDNTLLYKLAPSKGYIVVNPSATASNTGGTWDLTADPAKVANFLDRMIKAFHVDADRVHVDGFSQGSAMTFWFLCNRHELLASAAPVSGATDVSCLDDNWQPRVPIFYENGQKDQASKIDAAHMMVDSIVSQLKLVDETQVAGDGHYTRKRWTGAGGMVFDYLEHDYGGQAVLDGHCIPGGIDKSGSGKNNFSLNATTCTTGQIAINWGELALQWFIDHPRHH
jgi:pimeloyl-ACP methyl ester carboxylesterase